MVTVAFLGPLGSGKTTMLTRYGILTKQIHPYKKMYCNYKLLNYEYSELDLMDLYLKHPDEQNLILLADEIWTTMDCRVSSSYRNEVEGYFTAMTRKAKADFGFSTQFESFVDLRLSAFVKVKYIMEPIPILRSFISKGVKYYYKDNHPYKFKCHIIDERDEYNIIEKDFTFDGRKWFQEFNTYETIRPPKDIIQRIEINQMKREIQHKKLSEMIANGVTDARQLKQKKKE